MSRAAVAVLVARALPPPDRLFEEVDLDVRYGDDFLAPALHDARAERVPCGGVERLQRFLVPVGYEKGEVQEDAGPWRTRFPRRLVGNPDPALFGIVRENSDFLTEYRPCGEGPSLKSFTRLRKEAGA